MSNQSNQFIYRKTITESLTFVGKPREETRKQLAADGYLYDSKSRQWFRSISDSQVRDEASITA